MSLKSESSTAAAVTGESGAFCFPSLAGGAYRVTVEWQGRSYALGRSLMLGAGEAPAADLTLEGGGTVSLLSGRAAAATGGEQLDSRSVAGIPLNKRDFSQLLLLAAGTMTDTNGAANFTQQFSVNGQRGTATVFAMDGLYTADPEMGGATFSNFNVDAIQEVRSSSGVMPAEIGQGAAGLTEVVTKSGTNDWHGTVFWFVRNAALDARNFFDRRSEASPRRLPAFARNEFGAASGGPVALPRLYNGRSRTFYFLQYQGFRQVLGTTQVIPVPTAEERRGIDTTAFAGDTLYVPVDPEIAGVLARYPLPNDARGPYGARTYASSSKVTTVSDQVSARLDHQLSGKRRVFFRFTLNDVDGPLTNPSQTAIDPGFGTRFYDRQRNAGLTHSWTPSARWAVESTAGFLRTTPNFPTLSRTQPALHFTDGLYEPFNGAGGSVMGAYGNLWQFRQTFSFRSGRHQMKWGVEVRLNRDTTLFGIAPNGDYTFGGGVAPSPALIRSASGQHDVAPGEALPDALSSLLSGSAFSLNRAEAPLLFAQGDRIGDSAVHRDAFNVWWQDTWRVSGRLSATYGLRYEINSRIREQKRRGAGLLFPEGGGLPRYVVNPQPAYELPKKGLGPRLSLDYRLSADTVFRAGAAITTLLTNLWQENMLTGGPPFVFYTQAVAAAGAPIRYTNTVSPPALPEIYTPLGVPVFATGRSTDVAPNTEMDVERFVRELAQLSPDKRLRPLAPFSISARTYTNGYIGTWTAGLEQSLGDIKLGAGYVGTAGVRLPSVAFPNGYPGADAEHARYSRFDEVGRLAGGYGPISLMDSHSHSSFHSLQVSASKSTARLGLSFQASYSFSKSLDDTSSVLGGVMPSSSGALLQSSAQNPSDWRAEKGPSTFDITHVVAFSVFQDLPLARAPGLRALPRGLTTGWQLMNVTTLMTGMPFSVFSGLQQTGAGFNSADRPDQVGQPDLSTSRTIREDYFGRGSENASFFSLPVGLEGGSGPNQGRFGTLGRNTFRGPGLKNFDFALIKDTLVGRRGKAELMTVQLRLETFNTLNVVNLGLPSNIVLGTGFGMINRTAGTSRQIQLSLKLLY